MDRVKQLRYFSLILLLVGFLTAGTLTSCREEKKKENTEQAEHPEGGEEHPTDGGEEHPAEEEGEHPEGEEHPKDSVSG